MSPAPAAVPLPANEAARLSALRAYEVLDTPAEDSFDDVTRLAAHLTGCPMASVTLIEQDRQWFKSRFGVPMGETPRQHAFCAYAILEPGEAMVVPDATVDPRFASNPYVTGEPRVRAYLGMPLVTPDGFALGTLCVLDTEPRSFGADMVGVVRSLARTVQTNLELRRAMLKARDMALTDALTGLPNRPAFRAAVSRALERQRRDGHAFALVYLDLDGFKGVNDRLGHAAGDAVLAEAASALRGAIRHEDLAARLGGDEFAAVLAGGTGQEVPAAAERIRQAIAERMEGHGWPVTASVGAALFTAAPRDEDAALAEADRQMYAAKRAGRNRVAFAAIAEASCLA